jgi:hypothetical protein
VTDNGVILISVSIAESPSATDRYSGMMKKILEATQYLSDTLGVAF